MHHLTTVVSSAAAGDALAMAVVATLSKGYDLEYIWQQVDRGPAKDAAGYTLPALEWRHSARHSRRPLRPRPPRGHLHRNRPVASTQTPNPIHTTAAIP